MLLRFNHEDKKFIEMSLIKEDGGFETPSVFATLAIKLIYISWVDPEIEISVCGGGGGIAYCGFE